MREIKFRGISYLSGKFFYGNLTEFSKEFSVIENRGVRFLESLPVIYETVGQYTGLKDKNGKEIYEGDIISHAFCDKSLVIWSKKQLQFMFISNDSVNSLAWASEINIIGNMYENPDILQSLKLDFSNYMLEEFKEHERD